MEKILSEKIGIQENSIKKLKRYLSKRGHFWVSWPKSKKPDTDLNLPNPNC